MKQTSGLLREMKAEAEYLVNAAEARACADHLQAFNLGRTVQRLDDAPNDGCAQLGWLLIGAALGAALVAGFVHSLGAGWVWSNLR